MVKKVRNFKYKGETISHMRKIKLLTCVTSSQKTTCLFMHTNTLHIHHTLLQCLVMELRRRLCISI